MQWQMWTAFGIMVGYAADLAFYYVPDKPGVTGLNCKLMSEGRNILNLAIADSHTTQGD
jgi:hypothetical protein